MTAGLGQAVNVNDREFEYLVHQRGRISHLRGDPAAWRTAFQESLRDDFEGMRPYLPEQCDCLLDVGSGLGGIDILLARRYGPDKCAVYLLDGDSDPPGCERHAKTHSNGAVALEFLRRNGVERPRYVTPATAARSVANGEDGYFRQFDLVLSLNSWCFHYPPETYMAFVLMHCAPRARLIIDVRKEARWEWGFIKNFELLGRISDGPKAQRFAFERKAA